MPQPSCSSIVPCLGGVLPRPIHVTTNRKRNVSHHTGSLSLSLDFTNLLAHLDRSSIQRNGLVALVASSEEHGHVVQGHGNVGMRRTKDGLLNIERLLKELLRAIILALFHVMAAKSVQGLSHIGMTFAVRVLFNLEGTIQQRFW